METVIIELGARSYPVNIAGGLLSHLPEQLGEYASKERLLFVTDSHIAKLYWDAISSDFKAHGIETSAFILPPGEGSKSWQMLERLTDWLLEQEIERNECLVALGGGVIGDLTGFASTIVKRGCRFAQVPTTLLAQVDSSVGGKTAINSKAGKNLIGAFHQPEIVVIDPDVLDSLPPRELRAGYAEIVKYGLIDDADFFCWCESNGASLLSGSSQARAHAIENSVSAKARIVAQDELELSGKRALLNLGHTFGHALEAELGFSSQLLHGEAVAVGMALAARYSVRIGKCPAADAARISQHLRDVGLPASLAEAGVDASGKTLVGHMMHDKKISGGTLPFLLMEGVGKTYVATGVELADVAAFLDEEREHTT